MSTRRRLTNADLNAGIISNATRILKNLFSLQPGAPGAEELFSVLGRHYVGVLEWHFRAKPDGNRPVGKHKGISVFEIEDTPKPEAKAPLSTRLLSHGSLVLPVEFKLSHPSMWGRSTVTPREVRLLVLHTAECGETSKAAENLASWGTSKDRPKASWHFAVDNDSITQSVELESVAWHAGVVNGYSIGIEQAGRAAQDTSGWSDTYSVKMLENTAKLLAVLAGQYDIPLDLVTEQLATVKGVTTHAAITKHFKVKGGHTDPGKYYPIDLVLAQSRRFQLEAVT